METTLHWLNIAEQRNQVHMYYLLRDGSCHKKPIDIYRGRGGEYRFGSVRVATILKYIYIAYMFCFIQYIFMIRYIHMIYIYYVRVLFILTTNQLMVNSWFGARWFGFLGSPYERDCYLRVSLESQTTKPNRQFTISWLCFICQDEWEDQLEYAIAFHLIGAHRQRGLLQLLEPIYRSPCQKTSRKLAFRQTSRHNNLIQHVFWGMKSITLTIKIREKLKTATDLGWI